MKKNNFKIIFLAICLLILFWPLGAARASAPIRINAPDTIYEGEPFGWSFSVKTDELINTTFAKEWKYDYGNGSGAGWESCGQAQHGNACTQTIDFAYNDLGNYTITVSIKLCDTNNHNNCVERSKGHNIAVVEPDDDDDDDDNGSNGTTPGGNGKSPDSGLGGIRLKPPTQHGTLTELLSYLTRLLFWLGVAGMTLIVLYGGFQMIFSGGDPTKFSKGQKTIMYATIGLILILLSRTIVAIIRSVLTR
jgi:hypothetical protein